MTHTEGEKMGHRTARVKYFFFLHHFSSRTQSYAGNPLVFHAVPPQSADYYQSSPLVRQICELGPLLHVDLTIYVPFHSCWVQALSFYVWSREDWGGHHPKSMKGNLGSVCEGPNQGVADHHIFHTTYLLHLISSSSGLDVSYALPPSMRWRWLLHWTSAVSSFSIRSSPGWELSRPAPPIMCWEIPGAAMSRFRHQGCLQLNLLTRYDATEINAATKEGQREWHQQNLD